MELLSTDYEICYNDNIMIRHTITNEGTYGQVIYLGHIYDFKNKENTSSNEYIKREYKSYVHEIEKGYTFNPCFFIYKVPKDILIKDKPYVIIDERDDHYIVKISNANMTKDREVWTKFYGTDKNINITIEKRLCNGKISGSISYGPEMYHFDESGPTHEEANKIYHEFLEETKNIEPSYCYYRMGEAEYKHFKEYYPKLRWTFGNYYIM
jgi:hypothetical protein